MKSTLSVFFFSWVDSLIAVAESKLSVLHLWPRLSALSKSKEKRKDWKKNQLKLLEINVRWCFSEEGVVEKSSEHVLLKI